MARPLAAARRYAEAAFEVADQEGRLDRWQDDLALAAEVLLRPEVARIVANPTVPLVRRRALASELLGSRIGAGALRLVNLLIERGRVDTLDRVADEFHRLLNDRRGIVTAVVTTAVELTPDEAAAIRTRVEDMAASAVELRTSIDPELIGGLTIQVGDRLLDASIRGRLERLRDQLIAGVTTR